LKIEEPSTFKTRRGPWTAEEDELLTNLVKKFGTKKWAIIAELVPGRVGKQCRERWLNHLRTDVKKTAWTDEEDEILIKAQQELGNRWSAIARLLQGRPENSVKNRWNSLVNKKKRCTTEDAENANASSDDQSSADLSCNETPEKRPGLHESITNLSPSHKMSGGLMKSTSLADAAALVSNAPLEMNSAYLYKNEYPTGPSWNLFGNQTVQPRGDGNMTMVFTSTTDAQHRFPYVYPNPSGPYVSMARPTKQNEDSKGAAQGLLLLATLCT
jgi:hypothetical protein